MPSHIRLHEIRTSKINIIQLSPEGEVNSGGYIARHEASRYISTALLVLEFTKSDR